MRLLVYGDLQATESSEVCYSDPTVPLQRWRVKKFMSFLHDTYRKHRCDGLVDLGDTTNERAFIYTATLDILTAELSKFAPNKHGCKLTGNHEQLLKSTKIGTKYLYAPYFGHVEDETIASVLAICVVQE